MHPKAEFGVGLPAYCGGEWNYPSLEKLSEFCRKVEQLGYSAIGQLEHVTHHPPMFNALLYEPLIDFSALISSTRKLKFVTSVLLLPLRNPATVAQQVATLDVLSNGRFQFGAGLGWQDKEFDLAGRKMSERGKMFEEMIEIIKLLWTQKSASFRGRYWVFEDVQVEPKPMQKPHPPIIIGSPGGTNVNDTDVSRLLKRTAELGDGWFAPSVATTETIGKCVRIIGNNLGEMHRDRDKFHFMNQKFARLVKDGDDSAARRSLARLLGTPFDEARKIQFLCSKSEMEKRVDAFIRSGLTYLQFNVLDFDIDLLEFVAKEILPKYQ